MGYADGRSARLSRDLRVERDARFPSCDAKPLRLRGGWDRVVRSAGAEIDWWNVVGEEQRDGGGKELKNDAPHSIPHQSRHYSNSWQRQCGSTGASMPLRWAIGSRRSFWFWARSKRAARRPLLKEQETKKRA